jgi:hypothetical protein
MEPKEASVFGVGWRSISARRERWTQGVYTVELTWLNIQNKIDDL